MNLKFSQNEFFKMDTIFIFNFFCETLFKFTFGLRIFTCTPKLFLQYSVESKCKKTQNYVMIEARKYECVQAEHIECVKGPNSEVRKMRKLRTSTGASVRKAANV